MKTLRFSGHSDDILLVEVNGKPHDEADAYGKGGAFRVKSADGALRVVGHYGDAKTACWSIGVCLDDEGVPLPAWPMRLETGDPAGHPDPKPYSVALVIEVPDDAVLINVKDFDDE